MHIATRTILIASLATGAAFAQQSRPATQPASKPAKEATSRPTSQPAKGPTSRPASGPTSRPTGGTRAGGSPLEGARPVLHDGFLVKFGKDEWRVYGRTLALRSKLPMLSSAELVKRLGELEGKTVRVHGTIEKTCPKKGCWMWLVDGKARVFVRFQDYAFFVPKSGVEKRAVVLEGVVKRHTMSVEEARHYAEDAGDLEGAKKITKSVTVPFVMATGAHIKEPAQKKGEQTPREVAKPALKKQR